MPVRNIHTFRDAEVIDADRLNRNFKKIQAKFGTILNEDIHISASISGKKITENSQKIPIKMENVRWDGALSKKASSYSPDLGWYLQE
jgi:hypothetical protein